MKVYGRYGSFTPKPQQAGYYAKRAKRQQQERQAREAELGGPAGPEPTRFGDWERKGRVSDF